LRSALNRVMPLASSNTARRSSGRDERIASICPCAITEYDVVPTPVPMKSRWMSRRRHGLLFRKYWPSPLRKTRRVTVTSLYSVPSFSSQSAKVMLTSAMLSALRESVPLKMTSVIAEPRRAVGRCSPNTQRIESEMLLLPQPLGPTTAVMPGSKTRRVFCAKLLKPVISRDLRYTGDSWGRRRGKGGADVRWWAGWTGAFRPACGSSRRIGPTCAPADDRRTRREAAPSAPRARRCASPT